MARQVKVIRTKRLYKKSNPKKFLKAIFSLLAISLLVGFGYIVSMEWSKRFGRNAPSSELNTSSNIAKTPSSDKDNITSSKPQEPPKEDQTAGVSAYIEAEDLIKIKSENYNEHFNSLKTQGITHVAIEFKDTDGFIYFKTANEFANAIGAINENAVDIAVLSKAIKESGLKPIAILSALKDNAAAHVKYENSYAYGTTTNVNWLDNKYELGGKAWLNPYMSKARAYISALTGEIAKAGFEYIILNDVKFPEQYTKSMNTINENKPRGEILKQVLSEAQAAAGEAVVLQGVNIEAFANVNAIGYNDNIDAVAYKGTAPIIDMQIITNQIELIRKNTNSDSNEKELIKTLLGKIQTQNGEALTLPIIKNADLAIIEPILKELKLEKYILT